MSSAGGAGGKKGKKGAGKTAVMNGKTVPMDGNWVRDVMKQKVVECYLDIDIDG
jgi:hypothetical protein